MKNTESSITDIPEEMLSAIRTTFDPFADKLPSRLILKKYIKGFLEEETIEESLQPSSFLTPFLIREKYLERSFVAYNHELLTAIKNFTDVTGIKSVHELCCGTGWLTHWMRKYGVNVVEAVDNKTWASYKEKENFLPIVHKDDAIRYARNLKNSDMIVLSWPYMDPTATHIWNAMKPGQYLLYIGEDWGGCTADESFFRAVSEHEVDDPNFKQVEDAFVQFRGLHDRPILYKK